MIPAKQIIMINNRQISPTQAAVLMAALTVYETCLLQEDSDVDNRKISMREIHRIQGLFVD